MRKWKVIVGWFRINPEPLIVEAETKEEAMKKGDKLFEDNLEYFCLDVRPIGE